MEDIFRKLCKIAAGIESDQHKIVAKEKEQEERLKEKLKEKEEEEKDKAIQNSLMGIKKTSYYSKKMNRIVGAAGRFSKKGDKDKGRRKSESDVSTEEEPTAEEVEKKKIMETIIKELKDPTRDCNNFDPGKVS